MLLQMTKCLFIMSLVATFGPVARSSAAQVSSLALPEVELWGVQEIVLNSANVPANPFKNVKLQADFSSGDEVIKVDGFYDGGSTWKIRFMPNLQGEWRFKTISSEQSLDGKEGRFFVDPPSPDNHDPVNVSATFHFSYADSTPYFLLGTTSYNWLNRDGALQERTLATLRNMPFNKLRFGLFPKWFVFNRVEPLMFPYVRKDDNSFDLERFDPRFFANVEKHVRELDMMSIQADIILFHPYDK